MPVEKPSTASETEEHNPRWLAELSAKPAKPRAIGGGACVSSNLSTGTAIALGQSRVWSARTGSSRSSRQEPGRQTMAWKNFIGPHAITSRRRVVASALMYGLSLTVRFTSPTGEETENPAQAAQGTSPMLSIMIKDGVPITGDWLPKPAHAIVFQRGWPVSSRGCRAACERPTPMLACSPP